MKNILKLTALSAVVLLFLAGCDNDTTDPVAKTLVSIIITTPPTKTTYNIGDTLDLTGIVVTATYSDSTTETVSVSTANVSGFDSSTAGSKTLTVTYQGKTATFTVMVKILASITITTPPTKTTYNIGDTLDLTGIVVTATYSDSTTETVSVSAENVSGFDSSTAGSKTLTVTYQGKIATFTVTVQASKTVISIAITTPPTKTTYNIGDTLDLTGIVVTATYSDSTTETVNVSAENVSGFYSHTAGSQILTVTYQGKTATFTVTVQAPTVTFNSNGGSEVTSQTVAHGGKADKPADPDKGMGYGFGGWYKESGLTNTWDFNTDTVTNNITLYAKWNLTLNLGNTGPGGGIIFYCLEDGFTQYESTTDTVGTKAYYLEAAPNDMSTDLAWASSAYKETDIPDTATAIGTGRKNTALILATDADAPAAKACKDYNGGGKTDWFLPSKDELNELYKNRTAIGNIDGVFWSSSQYDINNDYVWYHDFEYGNQHYSNKDATAFVRAVRAF
jgi:uncharacterized repeat protein (TIGR02543 family)